MNARRSHHDVVVVGARCAGASVAMLLARAGHDVVVVDRSRPGTDTMSTHGIARGGVVQLARWGLLDRVLADGAPAIRTVSFRVGPDEDVRTVKDRAGVDLLVAPRRHRLDGLLAEAAAAAGADLRFGLTASGVSRDGAGRVRGLAVHDAAGNESLLSARFVIGADGLRSTVAAGVGADLLEAKERGGAIFYGYFGGVEWPGFEFHLAPGAYAGVFPTHDGEACVWVSCRRELARPVLQAGASRLEAFLRLAATVSPTLGTRLRSARTDGRVRGTTGLPNHRRRAAGAGWALVGDAGYHRDPITGHGMTDAFRDAELLAHTIDDRLRGRSDDDSLASYQAGRDAALREVFDLTCELSRYPEPARFLELQKRLSRALDTEAAALAAAPGWPAPTRAQVKAA